MVAKPAQDDGAAPANFRALYDAHAPLVRRVLHRHVSSTDLDDLVQETFVKAWSALGAFKGESRVATWLVRIALNVAKDHARARRRKWWLAFLPDAGATSPSRAGPDAEAATSDRNEVERAIAALSPKLREVVVLYSLRELEVEEIAQILELPAGTVKSRLHQARVKMRAALSETEEEES